MADVSARYAVELRVAKQDAEDANDRCMLARREAERLRTQLGEMQDEHRKTCEALHALKISSEEQLTALRTELATEQRAKRELEQRYAFLQEDNEREKKSASEVKTRVQGHLETLVNRLAESDRTNHQLQFSLKKAREDSSRVALLQATIEKRDRTILELGDQLHNLRDQYQSYVVEQARRQASVSVISQHNGGEFSPLGSPSSPHSGGLPPPPPPPEDAHAQQSARVVTMCKEWFKSFASDLFRLEETAGNLFDDAVDSKTVLERGRENAALDIQHLDRRRSAEQRELERKHAEEQKRALESSLTSVRIIEMRMSELDFALKKIQSSLASTSDSVKGIKKISERYCLRCAISQLGQDGVPVAGVQQQHIHSPVVQVPPISDESAKLLASAQTALASAEAANEQKAIEIASLKHRLASADDRVTDLLQKIQEVEKSSARSIEEKQALGLSASQNLHAAQRKWLDEKNELVIKIEELTAQANSERRQAEDQRRTLEHRHTQELRDLAEGHAEERRRFEERAREAEKEAAELKDRFSKAQAQADTLRGKKITLKRENDDLILENDKCHQENEKLRHQLELSEVAFHKMSDKNVSLEKALAHVAEREASLIGGGGGAVTSGLGAASDEMYADWRKHKMAEEQAQVAMRGGIPLGERSSVVLRATPPSSATLVGSHKKSAVMPSFSPANQGPRMTRR